ncbi:MAG: DUF1152 domain-containing protein [Deltaproteobacteria bacterium]
MSSLEKILKRSTKALLIGIGGGGDIVGTIPTAGLLGMFGIPSILGGLPWERSVHDPVPGPRTFSEILNVRALNDTVWLAHRDTMTRTGVRFAESVMAEIYETETVLVDITRGVPGVVKGLREAMREFEADLLIGVDVGGDAIAFGHEKGLTSPLADAVMTAALAELEGEMAAVLGVFGWGSDGELTPEELDLSLGVVSKGGGMLGAWGITPDTLAQMQGVVRKVPTEASRIPVEAAGGARGETSIRSGTRTVALSTTSTLTFYMSPRVVVEKVSAPARAILASASLEEANDALHALGITTELDLEREKMRRLNPSK